MRALLILYYVYATYDESRAAFDRISSELSQKVDAVTFEIKNISIASHGNVPASLSNSSTDTDVSLFALLGNSKLLPRLDSADFQAVVHWRPGAYRKLRRQAKKAKDATGSNPASSSPDTDPKDPILSRFLEDKDGNVLPESDKKAILATAASFWQYLLDQNRAPKSFRKANVEVKLKWQMLMESSFECLRYCDNHWKVDQIWINNYPSWLKSALRKIKEEEKRKEEERLRAEGGAPAAVIDVDGSDNDDNDDDDDDDDEESGNDEDGIGEVEEPNKNKGGKRAPPEGGETNKSKRARVEESTPRPRPIPTKKRPRVRTLY